MAEINDNNNRTILQYHCVPLGNSLRPTSGTGPVAVRPTRLGLIKQQTRHTAQTVMCLAIKRTLNHTESG